MNSALNIKILNISGIPFPFGWVMGTLEMFCLDKKLDPVLLIKTFTWIHKKCRIQPNLDRFPTGRRIVPMYLF
jgi:hypothetical protein